VKNVLFMMGVRIVAYKLESLIKVAEKYYYDDLTHNEIASETGLSRVTVTRMLKAARNRGIVRITIDKAPVNTMAISEMLRKRFGLRDAVIVDETPGYSNEEDALLYKAAANYFSGIIRPGNTIGLGWGNSVYRMIKCMESHSRRDATFIPIIGGTEENDEIYNLNNIVQEASKKSSCEHLKLYAPAIVDTKAVCEAIKSDSKISMVCDIWNSLDVVVVGIGALKTKMSKKINDFLSQHTTSPLIFRSWALLLMFVVIIWI